MLSNGEQGGSTYVYPTSGILPHAVRIVGTKTNAYDLVGNMVFRAGQSLGYDPENRLTSVVSSGVTLATFGYADDGDRLWKQSTNTLSVWIGDLYEAHGTTNLFHLFAGSRRIATYSPGTQLPGAGGTTNAFNYYHPDHLGSSSLLTDGNGAVVEHYEYSAYGRERANGTAAPDASHRFTGQIFDAEVGLYYYGARYYDADLGRFIQADTMIPYLFDPQSWNRYSYALNNPLSYLDPSGHEGELWYDRLASWSLNNATFSKDYLNNNAPWAVAGTLNTAIDMGNGLASFPSALGHLGEGTGTFSVEPTLENAPGMLNDISTAATVGAIGLSGVPAAKAPIGAPQEPTASPQAQSPGNAPAAIQDPIVARRPGGTLVRQSEQPPRVSKPDPRAEGNPHTVLRWDTKERLHGAKEYGAGGNDPTRDISFTQPTYPSGQPRPGHLPPPTQHPRVPNPTGGTPARGPEEPLKKP